MDYYVTATISSDFREQVDAVIEKRDRSHKAMLEARAKIRPALIPRVQPIAPGIEFRQLRKSTGCARGRT